MADTLKVKDSIKNFLLKMRALDETIPEELATDALEMVEEVNDALMEEKIEDEEIKTEDEEIEVKDNDIRAMIKDAVDAALKGAGVIKDSAMSSLESVEDEMNEEAVLTSADEEIEIEDEKTVIGSTDSIDVRKIISDIKPIIASVKDSKSRKLLADSVATLAKTKKTTTSGYKDIMGIVNRNKVADSKEQTKKSDYDFGLEMAQKFNPHYKKGE